MAHSRKTIFGVISSNLTGAALAFLVNIFLARMLDIAAFGKINFILSAAVLLGSICDFGFGSSLVVMHNRSRYDGWAGQILPAVNRAYLMVFPLLGLVTFILLAVIIRLYSISMPEAAILWLISLFTPLYGYLSAIHQATGNWRVYTLLLLANNLTKVMLIPLAVVLFSLALHLLPPYEVALGGYGLHATLIFLGAVLVTWRQLRFAHFPDQQQRQLFTATLIPLGLTVLLSMASMRLDRLIIQYYLDERSLGIYAGAATLAFVFPLITGSLMDVLLKDSAGRNIGFLTSMFSYQRRYFPLALAAFILIQAVAGLAIHTLFGPRYDEATKLLRVLLIPYFWSMFFTPLESYFMAHHPREILYLNIVQLLTVVAGSIALIPVLKLYGVALAIALSRALRWGYFYYRGRMIVQYAHLREDVNT